MMIHLAVTKSPQTESPKQPYPSPPSSPNAPLPTTGESFLNITVERQQISERTASNKSTCTEPTNRLPEIGHPQEDSRSSHSPSQEDDAVTSRKSVSFKDKVVNTSQSILAQLTEKTRRARVKRVIEFIEQIRLQRYHDSREVIPKRLFPRDYEMLNDALIYGDPDQLIKKCTIGNIEKLSHFFENELRYEYRPSTRGDDQLKILMTNSKVHENLKEEWATEVGQWLGPIKKNKDRTYSPDAQAIAKRIKSLGSASIFLQGDIKYEPDCSWIYRDPEHKFTYPGLLVEVVWSTDINRKKQDYFEKSLDQIKTIVVLDLFKTWKMWKEIKASWDEEDTVNRGPASLTIFHAARDVHNNLEITETSRMDICDQDGKGYPGKSLSLGPRDFIPDIALSQLIDEGKASDLDNFGLVTFESKILLELIDAALKLQKEEDERNEKELARKKKGKEKQPDRQKPKRPRSTQNQDGAAVTRDNIIPSSEGKRSLRDRFRR